MVVVPALLCTWPDRRVLRRTALFDLEPWAAGVAAPVVAADVSAPALGLRMVRAACWRGSGTWAQLWGMWALPFALGTHLAVRSRRGRTIALAAFVLGITICLHLLIGYLAMLSLGVWVLLRAERLLAPHRPGERSSAVGALATSAWMLVPLLTDAQVDDAGRVLRGTFYYDSFGARRVIGWLVAGRIFDNRRFPVVSVLALIGLAVCVWRFRRTETAPCRPCRRVTQPVVVLRPAGPRVRIIDVLPGATDLCSLRRATSPACTWPASTWRGSAAHGRGRRRCTRGSHASEWIKPAFAAGALGVVLIAVVAPGGGRALLVRADRRRVDLGTARRPVDG